MLLQIRRSRARDRRAGDAEDDGTAIRIGLGGHRRRSENPFYSNTVENGVLGGFIDASDRARSVVMPVRRRASAIARACFVVERDPATRPDPVNFVNFVLDTARMQCRN